MIELLLIVTRNGSGGMIELFSFQWKRADYYMPCAVSRLARGTHESLSFLSSQMELMRICLNVSMNSPVA